MNKATQNDGIEWEWLREAEDKVAKQYPYFCLNLLPDKLKDKFKKDIAFRYRMNKFIKLLTPQLEMCKTP